MIHSSKMLLPLLCAFAGAALADSVVAIFYTPNHTPTAAQPITYGYGAPTPNLPVTVYLMEVNQFFQQWSDF
jgi:hypothetical protein